ncbi:MAG: polysaccharide lyase [Bacteroidota bacterium]
MSQGSQNTQLPPAVMGKSEGEPENSKIDLIWSADFQDQEPGIFDYKDIKKEFGSNGNYPGRGFAGVGYFKKTHPAMENDQNITIEEENGNKFARNWFRGAHFGIVTPKRPEGSGHMFHPKIPGNNEELWISHNIRWPEDRDWALTGKIGIAVTGGASPGGCSPYQTKKHNGFIINLMWSKAQEMKLYMYWSGKDNSLYPCGLSGPFKWKDPSKPGQNLILTEYAGEWHNIALRIVLNDVYTPGKANGMVEAFWDGMLAFRVDTLRLRTEPGVFIDHARSYYNHGGNDDRFAPERDTYYDCDDVWTWTWKEGSGLPRGFVPWNKDEPVPLPNHPKNN